MDLQEIFQKHREERNSNITKGFVNELQQEQVIEKGRTSIQRQEGDIHPNGKWVWKKTPSGYDWRNIRGIGDPKKGQGSTSKKNESGNDVISIESSKYLLDHILKMQKDAKGFLYHTDGKRVSKGTIKNRIHDSKVNSTSILDVVGTKGEDKIDRSDMKDDKIAGSYMVKYKEKEDMYDLYKFKVSKKVSDEKQEPENFKFKVGDSVRIKDSVNMTSLLQHKDKDLEIVQVDKVDMAHGPEILYTFVSERGKEITVSEDNIEKYEPKNFEYKGHTIYTSVDKSGGQNTIIYQTKSVDKKYWDLEKLKEKIDNLNENE